MIDIFKPSDFRLRPAEQTEAGLIRAHYDDVIERNNSLRAADGTLRYIDWVYPFPLERVRVTVGQERLLVVEPEVQRERTRILGRGAIDATFITDTQPDPEIWHDVELPANALGFGKFAVRAALLGRGFGRTVAIPLLVAHARETEASLLYCDALPHLDSYYISLGFEARGPGGFYSSHYQKFVTVNRYTLDLDS